jgi:hypothetical protein
MNIESTLPIIIALIPLALGMMRKSFANLKGIGLITIGVLGLVLLNIPSAYSSDPSIILLVGSVLLSGFFVIFSQDETKEASTICATILIVLGLSLGVLLHQGLENRIFLIGLLGYIAVYFIRKKHRTLRTKITLVHIVIAIIFALGSVFGGKNLHVFASLFLAVTFLPLAPFHLPFVSIIENAKGALSSFWIVVWLAIGLSELHMIYSALTAAMMVKVSILALVTAVYASLACLGQSKSNLFVSSAAIAHVALIWGLIDIFASYPKWGIPFGVALALVMSGISLAFSFIQQRYGWMILGKLPGLTAPMPRFGILMIVLVSFAVFLPLFPILSGLMIMPTGVHFDVEILMILFMFLVVWLAGGWYFVQMLHKTAFGTARTGVPYSDIKFSEILAVSALLTGATYSGLFH